MDKLPGIIQSLKNGKKSIIVIALGVICLVLLFLSEGFTDNSKKESSGGVSSFSSKEYIEIQEKKLAAILGKIDGAGEVKVMLTLESCYENVYAKGYSSKGKTDGEDNEYEKNEEYIVVNGGSNKEECLVVKVFEPQIKGVAVVAEGGGNSTVKKAITDTVCAVYNISSVKVSVEKMKIQQ